MERKSYHHYIATKVLIKEVLDGTLLQEKEGATFLKTTRGNIYKINIMAVVVEKEKLGSITNILVDDSSSKIAVRFFDENETAEKLKIGNIIVIIGKIRIYQNEKYISPEIVKKINPLWLKVRSLELTYFNESEQLKETQKINGQEENNIKEELELKSKEESNKIVEEKNILPFEKVIQLIKELDFGEGVFMEEIIEKSSLKEIEEIIEKMLENGDIFQIQPGKVKIL